jgi:hypothetical protein
MLGRQPSTHWGHVRFTPRATPLQRGSDLTLSANHVVLAPQRTAQQFSFPLPLIWRKVAISPATALPRRRWLRDQLRSRLYGNRSAVWPKPILICHSM